MAMAQFWIEEQLAEQEEETVSLEAPHQKLIDGLTNLVLRELMTQDEAQDFIRWYQKQSLPDSIDESALRAIYKDYGLNEEGKIE